MFAISFLNPMLLSGAALCAIPFIIHILNKRRYKTVNWAAMEFLLRAFKENRRRIRLEQLLLLMLRMALPILLALLIARPMVSSDDLVGSLTRKVVHHVVILDDSGSMGESSGVGSSFDVARQEILKIAEALAQKRSGDLFTLLRSSSEKAEILGRPVSSVLTDEVRNLLKTASPTPDRLKLDLCLDRTKKITSKVKGSSEAKVLHVYLVSDLKSVDLIGDEGHMTEEIVAKLRALGLGSGGFKVLKVGKSVPQNLAIVAIERKQARSVAGQTSTFEVTVRNLGTNSSGETELGFTIDGGSRMSRVLPPLGPSAKHTETFKIDFSTAGSHWVEADLPKDRLDLDNRRALAFPVAESAHVLLIDGDPNESEERSEVFYVASVLDPDEDGSLGFTVTRIESHDLPEKDFGDFDLVVLANLASIDKETLRRLEEYVASGGGLFMLTGDQVETEIWNKNYWKDGKGMLPSPLKDIGGDFDKPENLILVDADHPFIGGAGESFGMLLGFTQVGRYHTLGIEGRLDFELPAETKVLVRADKENGPPILLEKPYGKGRVLLSTTTADASWHNWPGNPSYVILFRLAVENLMRREDLSPMNLGARSVYVHDLPGSDYIADARLLRAREGQSGMGERSFTAMPAAGQPNMLELTASPLPGRPWPMAGCFRLMLEKIVGGEEAVFFSVSPWEREGQLQALDERKFMASMPTGLQEQTLWINPSALAEAGFLSDEGEIWRLIAFGLLAFLFFETLLAWRVGHH